MNKRALTVMASATALTIGGLAHLIGHISPFTDTCYTNVTVKGDIRSSTLGIDVTSGTTRICNDLQEGETCTIYVEPGNVLTVTFDNNSNQFMYFEASNNQLTNLSSRTLSAGGSVSFAAAGADGSTAIVEGDPSIQVQAGDCG